MSETALARANGAAGGSSLERVFIEGDLAALSAEQRVSYVVRVCDSLGVNPWTKPFEYIRLNGKLVLYAKRDLTDQLRKLHGISITIVSRELVGDLYIVTARATDPTGRTDESIAAVSVKGLSGDNYANAVMKTETKAKRRVTLSICGLGMLDETEVASIPGAESVPAATTRTHVDTGTGEVIDVTSRVGQAVTAGETEPSYAAATVERTSTAPGLPQLKAAVQAVLPKLGWPTGTPAERAAALPYVCEILGTTHSRWSELTEEEWRQLHAALDGAENAQRRLFAVYREWCTEFGHDERDRELRLSALGQAAGRRIDSTRELIPTQLTAAAAFLMLQISSRRAEPEADAPVVEAELLPDTDLSDPFAEEG